MHLCLAANGDGTCLFVFFEHLSPITLAGKLEPGVVGALVGGTSLKAGIQLRSFRTRRLTEKSKKTRTNPQFLSFTCRFDSLANFRQDQLVD